MLVVAVSLYEVTPFMAPVVVKPFHTPSSSLSTSLCMTNTEYVVDDVQSPTLLLDDVLKGNSTAATAVVDMLTKVRGTDSMETYLEDMLPPKRLPLWTRLPLTRFSRRARQLRLSKLIELSTPSTSSENEESTEKDSEESQMRRARSSLFILLRNMASNPEFGGISSELSTAKKDSKLYLSSESELLARTPANLETPIYEVLSSKKGGFQIRRYKSFSVCSVTMNELKQSGSDKESAKTLSNPQLSGASSFGALAGYLFGKNEESKAMKMTTPVFNTGDGTMSFVLPSDYWEEEDKAPKPLADSPVKVASVDGGERAVLAFSGFGRKADVEKQKIKLKQMLKSDKEWIAVQDAEVFLAQYNDPFTPPWKRRNEVQISVMKKS